MTPVEHLKKAKEQLKDPTRWCKGFFAMDAEGNEIDVDSAFATRWCAMGAMERIGPLPSTPAYRFLQEATETEEAITYYNDSLGSHAALLDWFDRAIALARGA